MINHYFRLAGGAHYVDEIKSLMMPNDDYALSKKELCEMYCVGDKIFKNIENINKIDLVPEPDNPHDKNAIMVLGDGVKIGYIKRNDIPEVNRIMALESYRGAVCDDIWFGDYKEIDEDEDGKPYIEKGTYDTPYVQIILCEVPEKSPVPTETPPVVTVPAKSSPLKGVALAFGIVFLLLGLLLAVGGAVPDCFILIGLGAFLVLMSRVVGKKI